MIDVGNDRGLADNAECARVVRERNETHRLRLQRNTLVAEVGRETLVTRSFELNAKSLATKPVLWFISLLEEGHCPPLHQMKQAKNEALEQ